MLQVLDKRSSATKEPRELLEKDLEKQQNTPSPRFRIRIQSSRAVGDDLDLAFAWYTIKENLRTTCKCEKKRTKSTVIKDSLWVFHQHQAKFVIQT